MSDRMNVGDGEDRKMKRKLEEAEKEDHHHHDEREEHFLSLRICNNADMSKPLKVSKPTAAASGVGENNKKAAEGKRIKEFGCMYCMKKFKSSQALGGHQNAHRRERVIWKMEKELSTFGHPHFCPCSSIITHNNLPMPISRAASSSTFNPHFHPHGIGTHQLHSPVPNYWAHGHAHHHHQGQPKPGLSFGMSSSWNLNVEEKKPDVSSSGLDLSLRL